MPVTEETPAHSPSVWRYARASKVHVVVDAAPYFALMQQAFIRARQQIMMIGWDFDTRIHLGQGRRWWNKPDRLEKPARLGAFMIWLCKRTKGLDVRVLKWNFGALKFLFRGSMIFDLIRWWRHPSIDFKFDSAHPLGCSHHQKIVVIDDRFAVCGGIDMTAGRWDTPEHKENDPRRRLPFSPRLFAPWHDLTLMVEGEAALALGELGRARWARAGGKPLEPCLPQLSSPWPSTLKADFTNVEVGIARTRAAWNGLSEIREIEALFVEHIRRAKRFIYAESQYFASRKIAEAIAERVAEPDPPEILLINPNSADGWLEEVAMDGARVQLVHAIAERDHKQRFRIYIPRNAAGTPIYVHAKMMIVDDEVLRVGSANMNNRSLGLDTECDMFIDAARPGNYHVRPGITRLRYALLAEHLGLPRREVAESLAQDPSMFNLVQSAPRRGKYLEAFALRPLSETERAVADNALLDPERPEELFEPLGRRRGLFRRGSLLRRPRPEKKDNDLPA